MQLGSYEHRKLFCQAFVDAHIEYSAGDWPQLEDQALPRLRNSPFWSAVVQNKQQLALIASTVATQTKPTRLKAAITLLSEESERQAQALEQFMAFYQIPKLSIPARPLPGDLKGVLADLAFEQYLDAFVRWGWFALAREQSYLPAALLDRLDPLLQEEAHHSVFCANWAAGQRFSFDRSWRRLRSLRQYGSQFLGLLDRFGRRVDDATLPKTASATDIFIGQFTAEQLLNACITAHDQRLSDIHPQLVKPHLAPQLARWLMQLLRAWPQRKPAVATPSEL